MSDMLQIVVEIANIQPIILAVTSHLRVRYLDDKLKDIGHSLQILFHRHQPDVSFRRHESKVECFVIR